MTLVEIGAELAQMGLDIAEGRLTDARAVARRLLLLAIGAAPVDALKDSLTNFDRQFIDLSVDVAEQIKVDDE